MAAERLCKNGMGDEGRAEGLGRVAGSVEAVVSWTRLFFVMLFDMRIANSNIGIVEHG